jgi:hypothetical protein
MWKGEKCRNKGVEFGNDNVEGCCLFKFNAFRKIGPPDFDRK